VIEGGPHAAADPPPVSSLIHPQDAWCQNRRHRRHQYQARLRHQRQRGYTLT
jgi:hypothetical protein